MQPCLLICRTPEEEDSAVSFFLGFSLHMGSLKTACYQRNHHGSLPSFFVRLCQKVFMGSLPHWQFYFSMRSVQIHTTMFCSILWKLVSKHGGCDHFLESCYLGGSGIDYAWLTIVSLIWGQEDRFCIIVQLFFLSFFSYWPVRRREKNNNN